LVNSIRDKVFVVAFRGMMLYNFNVRG